MRRRGSAFGILLVLILMAVMGSFNSHEDTAAQQDITPQMPTTANLDNKHSSEAGKSQFDPVSSTKTSSSSSSPSNSYSSSSSSSSNNYGTYVANSNSGIFHYASCVWVNEMSPSHKIFYNSRLDAVNGGYRHCKVCYP